MIMIAQLVFACAAGCGRISFDTGSKKPDQPAPDRIVTMHEQGEGETRYYTFTAAGSYRISFSIPRSDVEAAEAILKELDREENSGSPGARYGLSRREKQFLVLYWQRIYHEMYAANRPLIRRLASVFRRIQQEQRLNDIQLATIIVRFVQYLQYELPPGIGIYSPARTLFEKGKGGDGEPPAGSNEGWNGSGDCDTKSLLLVLILKECGFKACVFDSYRYHHAMAGIQLPGIEGTSLEFRGDSYLFVETTYPRWNLGQMPTHYNDLSYFHPIDPSEGADTGIPLSNAAQSGTSASQGASEREPNNDRSAADLTPVLLIRGSLEENDPVDWYRLNGQEGTMANFTLIHDPGSDFVLEVYNGQDRAARTDGNAQAHSVNASIPGACYLAVIRRSGAGNYSVYITPGGTAEKEPDDSIDQSIQIQGMSLVGDLSSESDVDWYALSGQEGTSSTFTIYHDPGTRFTIEVYNNGRSVARSTDTGSPGSVTAEIPGRCNLRISSSGGRGWYLVAITRNR